MPQKNMIRTQTARTILLRRISGGHPSPPVKSTVYVINNPSSYPAPVPRSAARPLALRRFAFLADGPAFLHLLDVLRSGRHLARGAAHVHRNGTDLGRNL